METLFTQLDREWTALSRCRSTQAELAQVCEVAGVTSPADLVLAVRRADTASADAVLRCLASDACVGSTIAARALLQLLLPGTCRLASRWWALGGAEERAAAAVAAVYDRIRRYPIDRRPSRVAANILLDANHDLARIARRASAELQLTLPLDTDRLTRRHAITDPTPAEELRDVIEDAVAAGRVPPHWAALIVATHIEGDDLPSIARRTGTPVRTLQWRRRTAEAALIDGEAA